MLRNYFSVTLIIVSIALWWSFSRTLEVFLSSVRKMNMDLDLNLAYFRLPDGF